MDTRLDVFYVMIFTFLMENCCGVVLLTLEGPRYSLTSLSKSRNCSVQSPQEAHRWELLTKCVVLSGSGQKSLINNVIIKNYSTVHQMIINHLKNNTSVLVTLSLFFYAVKNIFRCN